MKLYLDLKICDIITLLRLQAELDQEVNAEAREALWRAVLIDSIRRHLSVWCLHTSTILSFICSLSQPPVTIAIAAVNQNQPSSFNPNYDDDDERWTES